MKKHYAFIPLKDKDLSSFRKSLLASLSPRPVFAVLMLAALGFIGFFRQEVLISDGISLLIFSLAAAFILYLFFLEIQKMLIISKIHKSSLLPFIHVRGLDSSFYVEEVTNGFIVQIAPVNLTDVSNSEDILSEITAKFTESSKLADYLYSCMNSQDDHLINKAVVYIEIIRDQLEKGNKEILATYDKLINFREDLC
jgi:hypothetical protein